MTIKNRVEKLEQIKVNTPERRLVIFEVGGTREPTEAEIAAYKETIQWEGSPAHIAYWNGEGFSRGINTDTPPPDITVSSEETIDLLFEICKGIEPHGEDKA
jgi:hypothetical protein